MQLRVAGYTLSESSKTLVLLKNEDYSEENIQRALNIAEKHYKHTESVIISNLDEDYYNG